MTHTKPSVLPVPSEGGSKRLETPGLPAEPSVLGYSQSPPFCPAFPGVVHRNSSQELD